jgi:Protein of unknown function (DUF429)
LRGTMIGLIGIDCSTDPRFTGLARGYLADDDRVIVSEAVTGNRKSDPAEIVVSWLRACERAIIALDAPLGWPRALSKALRSHRAGAPISEPPNRMFHRDTDDHIAARFRKRPLEVGANFIARTAHSALAFLERIRRLTGLPIPLAWTPEEAAAVRAIEVYPAATRLGYAIVDRGGNLAGVEALVDLCAFNGSLPASEHACDAILCVLGAADFVLGRCLPPGDLALAQEEGWIWAPRQVMTNPVSREGNVA